MVFTYFCFVLSTFYLNKMEKATYLKGCKRLQVIENFKHGVIDPEWEVFPTKTEGKYIVKPRENKETNTHTNKEKNNKQTNKRNNKKNSK